MEYDITQEVFFQVVVPVEHTDNAVEEAWKVFKEDVYFTISDENLEECDFEIDTDYTRVINSEVVELSSGEKIEEFMFLALLHVPFNIYAENSRDVNELSEEIFDSLNIDAEMSEDYVYASDFYVDDIYMGETYVL